MANSGPNPVIEQTYRIPVTGGATVAVNNLGTASQQVIAADPSRKTITFHNPNVAGSGVQVIVCQAVDANGNALTANFAAPGGGWIIYPGGDRTFTGDIQGAWLAAAASGTTNGLTVLASRS
jgi:hypothetical protein